MGKLMTKMKYEILKEVRKENQQIRKEMKIENEKLKADYNTKISSQSGKQESVEFDNANLLEKNAVLSNRIREIEGKQNKRRISYDNNHLGFS